jgi:hypothetical protein
LDSYTIENPKVRYRACLGELHTAPDPKKQLHSNFFVPNTPAPKTPDPPNPWI